MKTVTIPVNIMKVGTGYIAATVLGGVTIRGRRAETEPVALRYLFVSLAEATNDDVAIALELFLEGTTLGNLTAELERAPE